MAKRPSKHLRPARPLGAGHATSATKADGRWVVRSVPGDRAVKTYTCPGCQRAITPGTPHVVAWPAAPTGFNQAASPAAERRHWHSGCWARKH
ncbi:hypothetical protein ACTQ49_00945 [Luteococcus sp. Sow4_B9]|uniref:hypothetical protein n=1 Tax=Luteococcus sp. Sow4_B9 TaxID=3438792 RepID=UPI003F9DDA57